MARIGREHSLVSSVQFFNFNDGMEMQNPKNQSMWTKIIKRSKLALLQSGARTD